VAERGKLAVSFVAVFVSMAVLFSVPASYFPLATIFSTTCMLIASYSMGLRLRRGPAARSVCMGVLSAVLLYGVFYAGNSGINALHPFGLNSSDENSIYSLISGAGGTPYVSAVVLLFDSVGYESYFRGTLQKRAAGSIGPFSAAAVAAIDAGIHVITLNPLWVVTTFVADLVWGLTYYFSKDLAAPFASHLLWDIAIFVLFPIR
jgi:membrane protease YdiL (CAAX protease family)